MLSSPAIASRDGRIISVVGLAHCSSHFFQVVLPPLFPMLMTSLQISAVEVGLVMTLFFAVSGVCQTPAGFLVDRYGAARVLITGLVALSLGAALAAVSASYGGLIVAAILMGLGNSVFHPADYAILTHHVTPVRIGRAYGIHTVGGSLGWALGPISMVTIATLAGWHLALTVAALIGAAIALLVFLHRDQIETPDHRERKAAASQPSQGALQLSPIVMCFAFFALLSMAFVGLQNFMPLSLVELHGLSLYWATMAVTMYMLGMAAGTLLGGIAADKTTRHTRLIVVGLLTSALILLSIGEVSLSTPVILALVTVAGACAGFTTPSRDMLVRSAAPKGAAGKVFGFVYSGLDLGATVAPVLAGLMLDAGQPSWVFLFVATVTALSVLTATTVRSRPSATLAPSI